MKIDDLRARLAELTDQATNIRDKADQEKRDLTEEENAEIDRIMADFDATDEQIKKRESIENMTLRASEPQPRVVQPQPIANTNAPNPQGNGLQNTNLRTPAQRGNWGWNAFGDFTKAVIHASRQGASNIDPRLIANAAPSQYGSEGVGADGGFAVPPDFRATIMSKILAEDSLLSRTDPITTGSNQVVFPVSESAPWDASGGIQAYWTAEAETKTTSKPALGQTTIRTHKLAAVVPLTDELLEDATALEAWVRREAPAKIDFKSSFAIVQGTGVGQPLGILNSAATVVVAKETSQAADTIVSQNIMKMWSRMYAPWRANSVWLIHQDAEIQLQQMFIPIKNVAGTENVGGWPIYMPPGGLSGSPYATLYGRPVIASQVMETLGDKGDIILGDLRQYASILKGGGIRSDVSIHVWFLEDMTAMRFVLRVGGQPWWNTLVTPRDGSNTLGAFVTLAERA
jgi:HK97 family phage major capsid protein